MENLKNSDYYDHMFKIVMIGDSGVGKSNLLLRYTKNKFNQNSQTTIGVEFYSKTLMIDKEYVKT